MKRPADDKKGKLREDFGQIFVDVGAMCQIIEQQRVEQQDYRGKGEIPGRGFDCPAFAFKNEFLIIQIFFTFNSFVLVGSGLLFVFLVTNDSWQKTCFDCRKI